MFKKYILGLSLFALIAAVPVIATAKNEAKNPAKTLNGGGQIVDGDNLISFGGNIKEAENGDLRGQMQVNFHNVSNSSVSGGRFHSTEITDANWYEGVNDCEAAMNVAMEGTFNGEPGYKLIFRAGDNEDTVRFQLSGKYSYDSNPDYGNESNCVGTARANLDRGNVKIGLD